MSGKRVRRFTDLVAWQQAENLAKLSYELARKFPRWEGASLADQVRRAGASVPANIAEGFGRGSRADCCRCLYIARASLLEVEAHLLLATSLDFINQADLHTALALRTHAGRLLNGLINRLKAKSPAS
jgi:four helix bundle protein